MEFVDILGVVFIIHDKGKSMTLDVWGFKDPVIKKEYKYFIGGDKMTEEKKKPIKTFRLGTVKVSIWENEKDGNKFFNYQVDNSYKDKDDKWQETKYFNKTQLYDLATVIEKAMHFKVKED